MRARAPSPEPRWDPPVWILVVDDESHLLDLVSTALRYEGFEVIEARDGQAALSALDAQAPNLIVMDVTLPDVSGFEITSRLRAEGRRIPILFLTARDALEDRVTGLTIGGDDYLTKPFSLAELIARIHAVLRRTRDVVRHETLVYADLVMDEDLREVRRGDITIELTRTEFDLLRYFLRNPRSVLSKAQLLEHVWKYDFEGQVGVLDTYVSYLRRKLDPLGPPLIRTVRGVGYALRAPGD